MTDLPPEVRIVAFSATYSDWWLQSMEKKLNSRGGVAKLFVEDEHQIGKVPANIEVCSILAEAEANLADQLKAKLAVLNKLAEALKHEAATGAEGESTSRQVIIFHNFKAHSQ